MSDTYTFDIKLAKSLHTITVKKEFLKECPNPSKEKIDVLLSKYKMSSFIHNPNGPAMIRHAGKQSYYEQYWLDGHLVTEEEAKRIKHNVDFTDRLNGVISDPSEK